MIKGFKVRLIPTKKQEELMFKSINYSRFTWNWALNICNERYKNGEEYDMDVVRKEFTKLKKQEDYKWLNEVSTTTMVESMRNLDKTFKRFFKTKKDYPKFKSKKKSKKTFYVRYSTLYFENGHCHIEKIGEVKYKTNFKIPTGIKKCKFMKPYCSYDGKYWYLSFNLEFNENQIELNKDLKIGIDLGVKVLTTCSNGMVFKNINKTKEVKNIKKKLKRLQKKVSRKYEMNKQGDEYVKTNNIIKLEKQIKFIHRKLTNIRDNHMYQSINTILKERPSRIVMEDLNVKGIMRNKYLAESVAEQKFYKFISTMKYKCGWNGIEFVQADRFYPSSKTCSHCGHIKKDLKLNDRIYICSECGLAIDRDLNASINLMNYGL